MTSTTTARLLGLVALAAWGCDRPGPVGCAFEPSHLVATALGAGFHDLAIVPTADGAQLVYSDDRGLSLRALDRAGAARDAPRRLSAPCPAGLAALADGERTWIACARPADPDRGREGRVALLRVADAVEQVASTGPVGPESHGVALARHEGELVVGWRDAGVFTATARASRLRGARLDEPRPLSSFGTLASAPSFATHDGALLMAWTESWLDATGRPTGHLFVQRQGAPPRPSLDVGDVDVRVHLAHDARGPMVALRDSRPRGRPHRSFVGRLDENLALTLDEVRSPGRADAHDGRATLVPCGAHVFLLAARRSSREVTMVTVRRLDPATLEAVEPEHQIYEYHARFPQAVGVCLGERLLIAVGERQSDVAPIPRLRTYALRCGPGVPHERTPTIDGREHDQLE